MAAQLTKYYYCYFRKFLIFTTNQRKQKNNQNALKIVEINFFHSSCWFFWRKNKISNHWKYFGAFLSADFFIWQYSSIVSLYFVSDNVFRFQLRFVLFHLFIVIWKIGGLESLQELVAKALPCSPNSISDLINTQYNNSKKAICQQTCCHLSKSCDGPLFYTATATLSLSFPL